MPTPFIYSSMITRIVKLTLKEEFSSDFQNIFVEKNKAIENRPGCMGVKLVKDIKTKGVFFTISQWENEEALNNYRYSELFQDIWPKVKVMFADKAEAWSTEIC